MPRLKKDYISTYSPEEARDKYGRGDYRTARDRPDSDMVEVRLDDGSVWEFTSSECITVNGAFLGITPNSDHVADAMRGAAPVVAKETIHVLYQGSPLCGFSRERPVDWPEGHTWVPMAEDMRRVVIPTEKMCKTCERNGPTLFKKLFS